MKPKLQLKRTAVLEADSVRARLSQVDGSVHIKRTTVQA